MDEKFYRVVEFVTTFGKDDGKNESFENLKDFKDSNLLKAREKALNYYNERYNGFLNSGKYFLPFSSPENFKPGKHASFSISVYLVISEDFGETELPIKGEDEFSMEEGRAIEKEILET